MSQVPRRNDDEQLQRFFDGEATGDERAAVQKALAASGRDGKRMQARLDALGDLRTALTSTLTAEAEAADLDLWPALAARLDEADATLGQKKQAAVRGWRGRIRGAANRYGMRTGLALTAVAALLLVVRPWHLRHPENDCDVESLEVDGSMATVMSVSDAPHHGDGTTTIIWAED